MTEFYGGLTDMKKLIVLLLAIVCIFGFAGCNALSDGSDESEIYSTAYTNSKTYIKNADGTYTADGYTYKYRLEISGRMPNAAVDSTFVYLSNIKDITFGQAWKAAGFGNNTNDYFDVKDAVLVEIKTK